MVGTADAGLLWVLVRDRQIPDPACSDIVARLQARGISPAGLKRVLQPLL